MPARTTDLLHAATEGVGIGLFLLVNLVALVMIPLGLPGTFVQVLAAGVMTLASGGTRLGWRWVVGFLVLALAGELVELLAGQWGARRFGGSRAAAWGALLGGFLGAFVGAVPVPLLGSVVMSFVGTFAGALLGEMTAQRGIAPNLRVGWGALLGRAVGTGTKLFLGFVILIVASAVLVAQVVGG
jgi:uncharacterized protein YqgC (DUF456 family)